MELNPGVTSFTKPVSRKEACESRYWLRIVRATLLDSDDFAALERESDELVRILSAMIISAKRSLEMRH